MEIQENKNENLKLFNSKLKELLDVFLINHELQMKKDRALENKIEFLKDQLEEKDEILRKRDKKILDFQEKFKKSNAELKKSYDMIFEYDIDSAENDESSDIGINQTRYNDQMKNLYREIENLKLEKAAYFRALEKAKRSLENAESDAQRLTHMYSQIKSMYKEAKNNFIFATVEYENKIKFLEDYIDKLHTTLERNGIFSEIDNAEKINNQDTICSGLLEMDLNEDDIIMHDEVKPLRSYCWWKPSRSLTTIFETDESLCEEFECDTSDSTVFPAKEVDKERQRDTDELKEKEVVIDIDSYDEASAVNDTKPISKVQNDEIQSNFTPDSSEIMSTSDENNKQKDVPNEKPIETKNLKRKTKKEYKKIKPKRHYSKVLSFAVL